MAWFSRLLQNLGKSKHLLMCYARNNTVKRMLTKIFPKTPEIYAIITFLLISFRPIKIFKQNKNVLSNKNPFNRLFNLLCPSDYGCYFLLPVHFVFISG